MLYSSTAAAPAPTLTLDAEAPAAPALSLEPEAAAPAPAAKYMEDVNLSPEEQKVVDDFSKKIDLKDSNIVLQYGSAAQKKIAEFSDTALDGVKTKDLGEVGGMITNLVT